MYCATENYRIHSIRHRGYCFFHHAILCGFYLRVTTILERCLLNSGRKVKKSTASRKVKWLQTPTQRDIAMHATVTDTELEEI